MVRLSLVEEGCLWPQQSLSAAPLHRCTTTTYTQAPAARGVEAGTLTQVIERRNTPVVAVNICPAKRPSIQHMEIYKRPPWPQRILV